jgi:hypothetical protein
MKRITGTGLFVILFLLNSVSIFAAKVTIVEKEYKEGLKYTLSLAGLSKYKTINDVNYYDGGADDLTFDCSFSGGNSYRIRDSYVNVYNNYNGELVKGYNFSGSNTNYFNCIISGNTRVDVHIVIENLVNGVYQPVATYHTSHYFYGDNYGPSVNIYADGDLISSDTLYASSDTTLSAKASDSGSGLDETTWQNNISGKTEGDGKITILKNDGFYNVCFEVKDKIGNTGKKYLDVIVKKNNPVLRIYGATVLWSNDVPVRVNATIDSSVSGINYDTWRYALDNGSWNPPNRTNQILWLTKEGITKVYFSVRTYTGNIYTGNASVHIDTTAPVITLSGNIGDNWTKQGALTAAATDSLSGVESIQYKITGANSQWITGDGNSVEVAFPGDGIFDVEFNARDQAKNTGYASCRMYIDKSPPVIDLAVLKSFPWINKTSEISGIKILDGVNGVAASGIKPETMRFSLPGKNAITITAYNPDTGAVGPIKADGMVEGSNTLTVSAADNAGNTASEQVIVKYDSSVPVFNMKVDGYIRREGGKWVIPVRIFNIYDTGSGFDYSKIYYFLDNGNRIQINGQRTGNDYTAAVTLDSLSRQNRKFGIRGFDIAGNSTELSTDIAVDDTGPVFSCDPYLTEDPDKAGWYNHDYFDYVLQDNEAGIASYSFAVKLLQSNGYWMAASDFTYTDNRVDFGSGMKDGTYQLSLNAKDNANNQIEKTMYLKLDRTPPEISIPVIKSSLKTVTVTGIDNMSGVDPGSWYSTVPGVKGSGGYTVSLEEGRHELDLGVKDIAGNSTIRQVTIIVDLSPPKLTLSAPACVSGLYLPLTINAADTLTDITVQWYWLDNNKILLDSTRWKNVDIPLDNLEEGMHYIKAGATDEAGHTGESALLSFVIDRIPPEILGAVFSDTGDLTRIIEERDYISEDEVRVKIAAADLYRQENKTCPGNIKAFYWDIADRPDAAPVFSSQRRNTGNEFVIKNLIEGVNYIFITAEDEAGNFGIPAVRRILRDSAIPGPPVIRSTTHMETMRMEQAGPLSRADFQFSPAHTIKSGIAGYQWKLEKLLIVSGYEDSPVLFREGECTDINQEATAFLSLEPGDNEKNEFYRLTVRCIGGNRKIGGEGVYRFRIDSSPPERIQITAVPQADNAGWHNSGNALIIWNKPADMTGVAEYRYMITVDENWRIPDVEELKSADLSGWNASQDTEFRMNFRDLFGVTGYGTALIAVCAVDYSGNRVLGTTVVKSDFIPPAFKNTGIHTADQDDYMGRGKRISWGGIKDDESGPDRIVLIIDDGGTFRNYTLSPDSEEYIISPLDDNRVFTVTIRAYDRAGNKNEMYGIFATGNAFPPASYSVPYFENIDGYELSGNKIIAPASVSYEGVRLRIPDSVSLLAIQMTDGHESRTPVKELDLGVSLEGGNIAQARSPAGHYELNAGGFTLGADVVVFDRNSGLGVEGARYIRSLLSFGGRQNKTIEMGTVYAGFPPLPQFVSRSTAIGEVVDIETCTSDGPGFSIKDAEYLELGKGKEWFNGTDLSFSRDILEQRGIYLGDSRENRDVRIRQSRLEPDSRNLAGELDIDADHPLTLALKGVNYAVRKGAIRGSRLEVYEAVLTLPQGYVPNVMTLGNFIIDGLDGAVYTGPDFYTDALTVSCAGGLILNGEQVWFDSSGNLFVSGTLESEIFGVYRTGELVLTNDGIDWNRETGIKGFTTELHGFSLSADTIWLTDRGIYIGEGSIGIPGGSRRFSGLGLGTDKKGDIYQEGCINGKFDLESGYGSPIEISGGVIAGDGVFLVAGVPLWSGIADSQGDQRWIFPRMKIESGGKMYGDCQGSKLIEIAGNRIKAEDIVFEGNRIKIGRGLIENISSLTPALVQFTGIGFSCLGFLDEGSAEGSYRYNAGGWNIDYHVLQFDQNGIKGHGFLNLPEKIGGMVSEFPESRFNTIGDFISGTVAGIKNSLELSGVAVKMSGAFLAKQGNAYTLEIPNPVISLAAVNGPDMVLGRTLLNSDGTVLSAADKRSRYAFTSSNGYRLETANIRIENEGILLESTLAFTPGGIEIALTDSLCYLHPDLGITGKGGKNPETYSFLGWTITGGGFTFEREQIRIESNRISYRELELELGELHFGTGGGFLDTGIRIQNLGVSIFGGRAEITETRLSAEGLKGSLTVSLPAYLGGRSLNFGTLIFKSDGGFVIEKKIDKFGFNAGGFAFTMENVNLDEQGLYAEKTALVLPASMENAAFSIRGLRISNTGSAGIESAEVSPLKMWGMGFNLNNFSIVDGVAEFGGEISLPETMPGELSAKKIHIREFTASLDGSILSLDIQTEGEITVPFLDVWALSISGLRITHDGNQPWITLDQGILRFPETYAVQNAMLNHVRFNPLSGEFAYSEIRAALDFRMGFCGIDFNITELLINSELTVGIKGAVTFPASGLPAFISGKTAEIERFDICRDGTLGEIKISLEELEGNMLPDQAGIMLKKGHISLIKEGEKSLVLSVSGTISLTSAMPDGLAGTTLKIDTFTYDVSAKEITRLKASATLPAADLIGNIFTKLSLTLDWDQIKQKGTVSIAGNMKFPASFPVFLAKQEVKISSFKIGLDGIIQSFAVKYNSEKGKVYDVFSSIQLTDCTVDATYKSGVVKFNLAGTAILPENKFPQGIGGLRTAIAMEFDSTAGLKSASAEAALPDGKLFGAMAIRNGKIGISKQERSPLTVSVSGGLLLPDSFPAGLKGIEVTIRKFTLSAGGDVLEADIGAANINTDIFGEVRLNGGTVNFRNGGREEFLVSIGGNVSLLNSGLPENLKNCVLKINNLELSTKTGLKTFDIGISSPVSFNILGGIKISVNALSLTESSLTLQAGARLPAHYPSGLAGIAISLSKLVLGWDGTILDIQGGLDSWTMTLAGFKTKLDRLYFEKDKEGQYWVTLKSCQLQLPTNFGSFGGEYIAVKNAKFSPYDGSFLGDIEASKIETEIAGFKLVLTKPSIEFSESQLGFSKVSLKLPGFIGGGEIGLNKVTLSSSKGIVLSGGSFKLPSFSIGTLSFSNIGVSFTLSGNQYALEGNGSVVLPGAGSISAVLGFVTVSDTYPLGLKRAEFSYVLAVGGIPLGTSGLFINGIKGGISYGPPDEVPGIGRGLFSDRGPRITVGLHIGDAYGGTIIDMDPTAWIDITNAAWALEGNALLLRGKLDIRGRVSAAMGHGGFAGEVYVRLAFIEGKAAIYIFDKNGKTLFSGEGSVSFKIGKGKIINLWFIKIPTGDVWFGGISAAFGQFTNGKTGFKGTIKFPIIGNLGVFIGPGTFDIGSLSSYNIEKPSWTKSTRMNPEWGENRSVLSEDIYDRGTETDNSFQLYVHRKGKETIAPLSMLHEEGSEITNDNGLDRLIILLGYRKGSPRMLVTSPSGREYQEGSEGTETAYQENGLILVIHSTEAGIWQIRVTGLAEDEYELYAIGNAAAPNLTLIEPMYPAEPAVDTIRVRGITDQGKRDITIFARKSKELPGLELGTCTTGDDGRFDVVLPVGDLRDGEYAIYAEFADMDISPVFYSPGTVLVDRSSLPLEAPGEFRVAETDEGSISFHWINTNGGRTSGYNLLIRDMQDYTESVLYLGNITSFTLPGYSPGQELAFSVAALDEYNTEGPYSETVSIILGRDKPVRNKPVCPVPRIQVRGTVGESVEGTIPVSIENFQESADASGYILARYAGVETKPPLAVRFGPPQKAKGNLLELPWYLYIPDTMGTGTYVYPCEIINEANSALKALLDMEIEISWPKPEIASVYPDEINGTDENILTVYGSGFVPGTRAFWGEEELAVPAGEQPDMSTVELRVVLPPRTSAEPGRLTVEGPGRERAEFPVKVLMPDWRLTLFTRTAETVPGGTVSYPLGVTGLNGFDGNISFRVLEKAGELEISLPRIEAGERGVITIRAGDNAASGTYITIIEGGEGKVFELITLIRETVPAPRFSSVIPPAAYVGSEVHVYGYSLGDSGVLMLNDGVLNPSRWSDGEIVFTVPNNAASGELLGVIAGKYTNVLNFTVRERGFSIHPEENRVEINAGETKTLGIELGGFSDTVNLKVEYGSSAPFTARLDRVAARPDTRLILTIRTDQYAGNGIWKIVIHGESRSFEASVELAVHIGDSFAITTRRIPDGLVDTVYFAELESKNARGESKYRIIGGTLPPGLTMTGEGKISGRPLERGKYTVDIEAADDLNHTDRRSFTVTIWEETWGQAGKDGGQSRSVRTELPALNRKLWTFEGTKPVSVLIGADNRIIAATPNGITAVQATDGAVSWKVTGSYQNLLYASSRLYALKFDGLLEVRDPQTGGLLWSREGILRISSDGTTLLEETRHKWFFRNAVQGALLAERNKPGPDIFPVVWRYGTAWAIQDRYLVPLYGSGKTWDAGTPILALSMDLQGGVAATEQDLILFDRNMDEYRRVSHSHSPGTEIALGEDEISVLDKGYLRKYRRNDLELRWICPASGTVSTGKEKTVLAGGDGLWILNGYTGSVIWREQKSFTAAALYHEKIFAADNRGYIYAYEGPPNIESPETTLKIREDGPAGTDDWYTLNPTLEIGGSDPETYVSEIRMQRNDGPWEKAPASLLLGNGEQVIRAYGTDSRKLQGKEVQIRVKVDTEKPVSTLTFEPAEPAGGWYKEPLTLSLEAYDGVSGVEGIWINGMDYTAPVYLADQGIHKISWYARDKAGNREIPQEREIRIDREIPVVKAELDYDQDTARLELHASDFLSGIASIEYRINGAETKWYTEPLFFMEQGEYMIRYRAVDTAGNSGDWQTCEVRVRPDRSGGVLIGEAELDGGERLVMTRARNGLPLMLFKDPAAGDSTVSLARLPSYVLGAEYILWEEDDVQCTEDSRIRFRLNRDTAVYLFLPRNTAIPRGWAFVENTTGLNSFWYPGGTAVYMRRFSRSSLVELPGTSKGVIQPLIMVQELGSINADIIVNRETPETPANATADGTEPGAVTGSNPVFILDAAIGPWQHGRRLPLRKRWFVNIDEGWLPLEEGRYVLTGEKQQQPVYLRFRLEIYTPDGELEYRTEKAIDLSAVLPGEDGV